MSNDRYRYTGPNPNNNRNQSGGNDPIEWVIIVGAFVVFWPLGLVLLFRKLMGYSFGSRRNRRDQNTTYHFTRADQTGNTAQSTQNTQSAQAPHGAPSGSASPSGEYHYSYTRKADPAKTAAPKASAAAPAGKAAPKKQVKDNGRKLPSGKGLTIAGGIVTGVFGFSFLMTLLDALSWGGVLYELTGLGSLLAFTGVGAVLLAAGIGRNGKRKRYLQYLGLIGRRESVSISSLAKASGRNYKKVCDDLQDMLNGGVLPVGYLDLSDDKLVLSADGIADAPAEEAAPVQEDHRDDSDVLSEIRAVNDDIADEVMSAKIDRIEEITGKILDYQRKNPSKAGQLRNFLGYYLPTTLKILRAYAQLEEQGIEGENISAAKGRIEGMMDKVVEGFEKQLDKLFQDDAMDITTDVAVLEQMLRNDGLSQSGGLTMGGGG